MTEQTSATAHTETLHSTLLEAYLMIEELEAKLAANSTVQREPIAIVGMGCRFPGAPNPKAFWQLLYEGIDATRPLSDRFAAAPSGDLNSSPTGSIDAQRAGLLDEIADFDPLFFGISPREAIAMMPEQRLLLEVAWEALEDGGINPHTLRNTNTGVFIGYDGTPSDYMPSLDETPADLMPYIDTGGSASMLAGRLAYFLGTQGPTSVTLTTCSSALVAAHNAIQSLHTGDCSTAIVGGVQLNIVPRFFILGEKMGTLAADGRCKTFDAAADGYCRGEGCGVVVFKRQADAVANGDRILALIHGSAVNNDGPSAGLTVPNGMAQEQLIRQALQSANVTPDKISYIEAHGIGTALGDPIEIQALGRVFGERQEPLLVGSVKTNIGHLEAAAGMASLLKVIWSLQHATIPRHLHLKTPNPAIAWDELPIAIPTTTTSWPTADPAEMHGRMAGISAFGVSGTNAHLILGEVPALEPESNRNERPYQLLTLSARSQEALQALAEACVCYLSQQTDATLQDIALTANHGRAHFSHRLAITAANQADAHEKLARFVAGEDDADLVCGSIALEKRATVAFLCLDETYSINVGRELYTSQPTFRSSIDRCDEWFQSYLGESLLEVLYAEAGDGRWETGDTRQETRDRRQQGEDTRPRDQRPNDSGLINQTTYTQPALFALEYALAKLWQSWGIEPDMVIGEGVGELVAACVAGVFGLDDGLKLAAARGRLMMNASERGEVAAQRTDDTHLQNARLSIGTQARFDPMLEQFADVAKAITYSPPQLPIIASSTDQLTHWQYWVSQADKPVSMADYQATLQQQEIDIILEIGVSSTPQEPVGQLPTTNHRPLVQSSGNKATVSLLDIGEGQGGVDLLAYLRRREPATSYLPSLRTGHSEWQQMLMNLGELYVRGVAIDWNGVDQGYHFNKVVLPTYPFQRQRYWLDSRSISPTTLGRESEQIPPVVNAPSEERPVVAETNTNQQEVAMSLTDQLAENSPDEWHTLIVAHVHALAARILHLDDATQLNTQQNLITWGLDSVMAMELRNQIRATLPTASVPVAFFIDSSIAQIATLMEEQHLHAQLTTLSWAATVQTLSTIDDLHDNITKHLAVEVVKEFIL